MRFFRERRIATVFVDLSRKPLAPAELSRFSARFSARELLDEGSPAFRESGLGYMRFADEELFERLLADQSLLRLPLVRAGQLLSVGLAEQSWRGWLIAPRAQ